MKRTLRLSTGSRGIRNQAVSLRPLQGGLLPEPGTTERVVVSSISNDVVCTEYLYLNH